MPGRAMASSIKVTWDPALVQRGAVVVLKIQSPVDLMAAEAATGQDRFPLLKIQDRTYLALIGVDLLIRGPSLPVDLALFPARGGPPYRIRADLKIRDSASDAIKVQKLSLPTGMVDFSKKRTEQVLKDSSALEDVLAARSRERFWTQGFHMPLEGRITTKFGTRRVLNGKPRSPHNGVDIAGRKGTPVKVSNSGIVRLAAHLYLSGNTVVVDHGWGVSTLYAHLERMDVREGQEVARGQILGTVGSTGRSTGPHLHFGAFIRGAKVDPLKMIEATKGLGIQNPESRSQ
jgi:murein DD-endopeptidase MepM/ murein hydrolase activator NlpD